MGPATIVTERLVLVPLQEGDADEMVTVLADASMYDFTGGEPPTLAQLRRRYGLMAVGHSDDGSELWFNWIVRLDGVAAGVLQATVTADGSAADVAWEVGAPWQRRGIASEGAAAIVAWLVEQRIDDIRACVHPEHEASARVAAAAGLVRTDEEDDGEIVWRRPSVGRVAGDEQGDAGTAEG